MRPPPAPGRRPCFRGSRSRRSAWATPSLTRQVRLEELAAAAMGVMRGLRSGDVARADADPAEVLPAEQNPSTLPKASTLRIVWQVLVRIGELKGELAALRNEEAPRLVALQRKLGVEACPY